MERQAKPVTLLTGFLGSGKTTLLNEIIAFKQATRFAIVENEIGEEGVDGDLVIQSDDNIVEMNNGCLCCTLNENLLDILTEFHERDADWDEMVIEATGIADPAGIAFPFLKVPAVRRDFHLQRTICLVDVELVEDRLRDTEEAAQQIAFSDILLINKTDQANPEDVERIRKVLQGINPLAEIMVGHKGNYPLAEIFAYSQEQRDNAMAGEIEQPKFSYHPGDGVFKGSAHLKPGHGHHQHQHSQIDSFSFRFNEPFELEKLGYRLNVFLTFQSKGVYRLKGIVYDPARPVKIIVQSVGKNLSALPGEAWKEGEKKVSRFVVIGRNLKAPGLEKMLREGIRVMPEMPGGPGMPMTP